MSESTHTAGSGGNLPDHACPECTAICRVGEPCCRICGAERPSAGWAKLDSLEDPYLGAVLDERYLISRREARGGSAIVYRAERLVDGQLVALKIARMATPGSELAESVRRRMRREVRAVQILDNPHIVPVYELIELEDGPCAIVMEFVGGETVEEVVDRRGPMEVSRAATLGLQVARGLRAAHRAGLLHRDVKPANLMVVDDETGAERAKILDFGIARLRARTRGDRDFVGTPLYASPEQIRTDELDERSDVYNLGATLFYLLTGRPPFDRPETMEVLRAQLREPVPEIASLRAAGSVPEQFEELIRSMLAKDPSERPAGFDEVASRIGRWAKDEATGHLEVEGGRPAADVTVPGLQTPLPDSADGSGDSDVLADGGERSDFESTVAASDAFTPVAEETSEFASLAERTAEAPMADGDDSPGRRTQTGLQSLDGEQAERRIGGETSVSLWDEEDRASSDPPDAASREGEVEPAGSSRIGLTCAALAPGGGAVVSDVARRVWYCPSRTGGGEAPHALAEYDSAIVDLAVGGGAVWVALTAGRFERVGLAGDERRPVAEAREGALANGIDASADEQLVVGGTQRGCFVDVSGAGELVWSCASENIRRVAVAEDGGAFAVVGSEDEAAVFEPDRLDVPRSNLRVPGEIGDLAVSNRGELVAFLDRDGRVEIRQTDADRRIARFETGDTAIRTIFFAGEGDLHGLSFERGGIAVFDCATGEEMRRIPAAVEVRAERR